MTDREAIEWLVEYLDDYYDELYTTAELTPDVANVCLSALQEREERARGCEFCRTFNFSTARCEVTKHGTHICIASTITAYPKEEQFNFCPMCGRKLKGADNG